LAFVNRLEEVGNDAANRGDIRGSVVDFKAQDFAAALDISVENVNKLFAVLENPDIGWIADGMIVDFHDRNPDIEDPTAADRQRRHRSRSRILRKLADLGRIGLLLEHERLDIEASLSRLDHVELVSLQAQLSAKSLKGPVTRDSRLSQRDPVSPSANPITISTEANNVTRDNVTVTPDQSRVYRQAQSASRLTSASVETAGSAVEEKINAVLVLDPSTWLKQEGAQWIMDCMGESYERSMARLLDWSAQVNDGAVLAGILQGAQNLTSHRFHMEVTDQIRRLALRMDGTVVKCAGVALQKRPGGG
jgi:hypothetical protein